MRKENNHRSEMVSQLLYGDCFKIIGTKKEWLQITTLLDSYTGWIDNKQSHTIEESIAKKVGVETPSYAIQLIDYLETQNNELIALVLGSNVKASSLLKHTYEGSQTTGEKEKSNLLKIASLYLNTPYLWGGKTPFGIDCSGFTQLVYKLCGYSLLRDAKDQATQGEVLSFIEEAEPGDLAFFDNDEGIITHVGIIMDNYNIIHAHGKVRIDTLDHSGIYNVDNKLHTHKLRVIKKII